MSHTAASMPLSGWGRMEPSECLVYRPERQCDLREIFLASGHDTYLARGLGRSYGDTSVNPYGAVIDMTRLDRMLDFDPATGVLHAESGVSLADIVTCFLPRGFFLPVTPGTKFVTLGGAIANDVHGKNHHCDGTFSRFVQALNLLTPSGEILHCTPTENAPVFWATVGGVGLTGIIIDVWLKLHPVESAYCRVDYTRCPNLDALLETMERLDEDYKYSVAWVDCLSTGKSLGRSVLMHGNHAPADQLPPDKAANPYQAKARGTKAIPIDFPAIALNPWSIRAFNEVFYRAHPSKKGMIVDYDRYFYPLDHIHQWNRMYGKPGFVQFQATVPEAEVKGLGRILERLAQSKRASFLGVLKRFGDEGQGLLSHPMKGFTLTLDIPNRSGLPAFLRELEAMLLDHYGRLYLAKDRTASAEVFAPMYPKLDQFQEIQAQVDPEGKLTSSLAQRLGIVPGKGDTHAT